MVPKNKLDKTLTIGFLNQKIEENLESYCKHYDIVLTKEEATFYEVEKIINEKEGSKIK